MFREISVYFGIYTIDQVVSDRRDKCLKRYSVFDIFCQLTYDRRYRQTLFVCVSLFLFVSFVILFLYCIHATILWWNKVHSFFAAFLLVLFIQKLPVWHRCQLRLTVAAGGRTETRATRTSAKYVVINWIRQRWWAAAMKPRVISVHQRPG